MHVRRYVRTATSVSTGYFFHPTVASIDQVDLLADAVL